MKKIKKYKFLIIIGTVVTFLCIFGFTYGKYVSDSIWNYYLESKGFYFSSNKLGSTVVKNVDNLWDGESVTFNLKNSLNSKVITNYDINYSVSCSIEGDASSHAACYLNGTSTSEQTGVLTSIQACSNTKNDNVDVSSYSKTDCELGGYDWVDEEATNNLYFDVVLTDTSYTLKDVTVDVTVNSTSPYKKQISGQFILHKSNSNSNDITMDYKTYTDYNRLIVANSYNSSKCVKLSWNADDMLIDTNLASVSSSETDTSGYINAIKFNIPAKSSLSYVFYNKNLLSTYNVDAFTIEQTTDCN